MDYGQPDHRFHPVARSSHRPRIFDEMSLRKYSPHSTGVLSSTHSPQPRSKLSPSTQKTPSSLMVPKTSRVNVPTSNSVGGRSTYLATTAGVASKPLTSSNGLRYFSSTSVRKSVPRTGSLDGMQTLRSLGVSFAGHDHNKKSMLHMQPFVVDGTLDQELALIDTRCNKKGINNPGKAFLAVILAYPHAGGHGDPTAHWTLVFLNRAGMVIQWRVDKHPDPALADGTILSIVHIPSIHGVVTPAVYTATGALYPLLWRSWDRLNNYGAPPSPAFTTESAAAADAQVLAKILSDYRTGGIPRFNGDSGKYPK